MGLAERIRRHRIQSDMSVEQLAEALGVPPCVAAYLEEPEGECGELEETLAQVVGITVEQFRDEVARPSREELHDAQGRYPAVRAYLLATERCEDPPKAREAIGENPFSELERDMVRQLATAALYSFCDTNLTTFAFDNYLYAHHGELLERLRRSLDEEDVSPEEREERLHTGRVNIFVCERVERIAEMILNDFVAELESRLQAQDYSFEQDTGRLARWAPDESGKPVMRADVDALDAGGGDDAQNGMAQSRRSGEG